MINLTYIVTFSFLFLAVSFLINNNFMIEYIPTEEGCLKFIALLEENHFMIPYVLQTYYGNVISLVVSSLPYILISSTFWHNNGEIVKENFLKKITDYISRIIKKISLVLSLILYGLLLIFWASFDPRFLGYQFLTYLGFEEKISNLSMPLGLDALALPFLILIGFIFPIVFLSSWSTILYNKAYYLLIIILLELFLALVFLAIDMIMFYTFFESILPLLFALVGFFGAVQKFRAGTYLFLYTLVASVFMLLAFVKWGGDLGNTSFLNQEVSTTVTEYEEDLGSSLSFSFSVKTPLSPGHIWLPLAHSDASVAGSIILAAIVLKLSLYGFIRLLIGLLLTAIYRLAPILYSFICISVVYASATTIRQFDLKVMVAYSSIAHMASSLLGAFSNELPGVVGSILFGVAHGLVSPALFILVGAVLYDRCGSRIINYYRGLSNNTPIFAFIFLLFMFANMGVPLTGNFIGEFLSLIGAYQQNIFITSIGAISIILSAVYSIYVYNRITSGSQSPFIFTIPDLYRKEYYILLPLLVLTIILGIFPSFITSDIEFGLSQYLLFSFFPVVMLQNDRIHELNCNPHNTPEVPPVLPTPTPSSSSRNANSSNRTETASNSNADSTTGTETASNSNTDSTTGTETASNSNANPATGTEEVTRNTRNQSNLLNIGNRDSEEGTTPYVPLDDRRNQPVDSRDLTQRLNMAYPRADPNAYPSWNAPSNAGPSNSSPNQRQIPGNESENLLSDLERNRNNVDTDLSVNSDSSSESSSDSESPNNLRDRIIPTNFSDNIEQDAESESESNFADDEHEEDNNENYEENNESKKDLSDSNQDKKSESTQTESSGSRNNDQQSTDANTSNLGNNNDESTNVGDSNSNSGNNNESTDAKDSNEGNNNESTNANAGDSNGGNDNESTNAGDSNSNSGNNNESSNAGDSNSSNNNESTNAGAGDSNSGNNNESRDTKDSNEDNNDESMNAKDSNENNNEEESESKDNKDTADNKESSSKDKDSKDDKNDWEDDMYDPDYVWSDYSDGTYKYRNIYGETVEIPTKGTGGTGPSKDSDSDSDSDSNKGQNNYSIENENKNTPDTYTFSGNDSLNDLLEGYYIFIPDYFFSIINFIHNNLTFDLSNVTPMHIIFLLITFISYYRYYILCISYKDSFNQCLIILRFWIKEIFSFLSKK